MSTTTPKAPTKFTENYDWRSVMTPVNTSYPLTILLSKSVVLCDGVTEAGGLLYASTLCSSRKLIPIYEFKYNDSFCKFYKEHIDDLRDS